MTTAASYGKRLMERRLEYQDLDTIEPATSNPKEHQIDSVRASIDRFGYVAPMIADDRTGRLVVGHGRLESLKARRDAGETPPEGIKTDDTGRWFVPVIHGWASRSDADAAAYLVLDNRQTELGGWDHQALADLLDEIGDPDLIELTGWDPADLEQLLDDEAEPEHSSGPGEDQHRQADLPADPVSKPGDIWKIGPHRIICGDCRNMDTITLLMSGTAVNIAFTSPPYASQRRYDESSGFKPIKPEKYVEWFEDVQANVRNVLADDGSWFVNIKEHADDGQRCLYVKDLTIAHVRLWGWLFVDELCWVDSANGFPGSFPNRFKNAWEPVFHFSANKKIKFVPLANSQPSNEAFNYHKEARPDMGLDGYIGPSARPDYYEGVAIPSNVIHIPAGGGRGNAHTAAFPLKLPAWFIRAYSDPGDAVLDPFAGSGTTILAAHQEQRIGYGCEISPAYCDMICHRLQTAIGIMPELVHADGTTEPHDFTSN